MRQPPEPSRWYLVISTLAIVLIIGLAYYKRPLGMTEVERWKASPAAEKRQAWAANCIIESQDNEPASLVVDQCMSDAQKLYPDVIEQE
jgi:invasion protein IalB